MKTRKIIIEIICALFILLFVYASTSKLSDLEQFRVQLGKSPLLASISWVTSIFIPVTEMVLSILLTFKATKLLALYSAFTLMAVFTAYVVTIIKFSPYIPCSCGGILENMNWNQHLIFNIGFLVLGGLGVLLFPYDKQELTAHKRENLDPVITGN